MEWILLHILHVCCLFQAIPSFHKLENMNHFLNYLCSFTSLSVLFSPFPNLVLQNKSCRVLMAQSYKAFWIHMGQVVDVSEAVKIIK